MARERLKNKYRFNGLLCFHQMITRKFLNNKTQFRYIWSLHTISSINKMWFSQKIIIWQNYFNHTKFCWVSHWSSADIFSTRTSFLSKQDEWIKLLRWKLTIFIEQMFPIEIFSPQRHVSMKKWSFDWFTICRRETFLD